MEPAGSKPSPNPSPASGSPSSTPSQSPPKESLIAQDALQISKPTEFKKVDLTEEQKEAIRKHQEAKAAAAKGLDDSEFVLVDKAQELDESDFFLLDETSGTFQGKEYAIAPVVDRIIDLIKNNPGLTTEEGVFRLSGNNTTRTEVLGLLRKNSQANLPPSVAKASIHDLIHMLKGILREKTVAILEQKNTLEKMASVVNEKDPEQQKATIKYYVNSLKDDQKKMLAQILPLVDQVIKNQQATKMGPTNMATTLGLTLSPKEFGDNPTTIKIVNAFAEILFTYAADIEQFLNRT